MKKQHSNWHQHFSGILGLCLGLAFHADAQQRGGGGGGGFGGAARSAASTAGGSQSQLMQAAQGMKEAPMSFNMQDLQKPSDPKRKH